MKKTLAIVLALVLVLCAVVALAETKAPTNPLVNGNYEPLTTGTTKSVQHRYWTNAGKDTASYTDLACVFEADKSETKVTIKDTKVAGAENELAHIKVTTVTTTGHCKYCLRPMADLVKITEAAEAHTLVRGAYKGQRTEGVAKIAHNDYTHLVAYDQYEAVCSVCGLYVTEEVPVYKAHAFQTKNPRGYDKDGKPTYKMGNVCKDCGYTRVYKDLTTAAGLKVAEIIAALEDAGMTVEFDADQLIAVGIEEGEVGEVEGCGVATINFSNWTPIAKGDSGKQLVDNGSEKAALKTNEAGTTTAAKIVIENDKSKADAEHKAYIDPQTKVNYGLKTVTTADKKVNFNQEAKSYEAAYVTMTVDGTAHRVYFYNRHDPNGWVYAFEADMIENTAKTTGNLVRCGAGQEYASVGSVNKGAKLDFIGVGYETEGYNTSWNWGMISDFEFVCIGK